MIGDDLPTVNPSVDLSKILPIQQKRMIAFVNHFIMNWVSYLNSFAQSCESRFMQFEYKMQKVEASLMILESQLSSVTSLNKTQTSTTTNGPPCEVVPNNSSEKVKTISDMDLLDIPTITADAEQASVENNGLKAKDSPQFSRFFKMLHVGVPLQAVKLKMQIEGIDPNILDNPDTVISES